MSFLLSDKVLHHAGKGRDCQQTVLGWLGAVALSGCSGPVLYSWLCSGPTVREPAPVDEKQSPHMSGLRMLWWWLTHDWWWGSPGPHAPSNQSRDSSQEMPRPRTLCSLSLMLFLDRSGFAVCADGFCLPAVVPEPALHQSYQSSSTLEPSSQQLHLPPSSCWWLM